MCVERYHFTRCLIFCSFEKENNLTFYNTIVYICLRNCEFLNILTMYVYSIFGVALFRDSGQMEEALSARADDVRFWLQPDRRGNRGRGRKRSGRRQMRLWSVGALVPG